MRGVYLVGGYPNLEMFDQSLKLVIESGKVDFIEIGIPFSDPVADGEVIREASYEVIESGVGLEEIVEIISRYRDKALGSGIKIYMMTYANILYGYGISKFCESFDKVIDGVIVPDIPNRMSKIFKEFGFSIDIIPFITPNSRVEELQSLKDYPSDFIYAISVNGTTGGGKQFNLSMIENVIESYREISDKKVVVGFGVKSRSDVGKIFTSGCGVVIGSEIVKRQKDLQQLEQFIFSVY